MRNVRLVSTVAFVSLAAGCSGQVPRSATAPDPTARATPASSSSVGAPPERRVPLAVWENFGGMWLPEQLPIHDDALRRLGFELSSGDLAAPTRFPLGAIVSLGGCSGSFVSASGLVATNHHCVTDALQYGSTPADNLLRDGFNARQVSEEKPAGPTARVYVTRATTDVSGEVRLGIDAVHDDLARQRLIEGRRKALVRRCEQGRPELRCSVAASFGGERYTLVEQLELRDVRLVYAPPEGIGNFGGEIDNWRWPRHTGDFAFLRAYVGPDGSPADPDPQNVPYRPAHVLPLAREPLRPGAAVLVAGYPWSTNRLTTAAEARQAVQRDLPYEIDFCQTFLAEIERLSKNDTTLAIRADGTVRGLSNWLTNARGQLEGMVQGGLVERKASAEAALEAFIRADPAREQRLGGAVQEVSRAFLESRAQGARDASIGELEGMVRLFSVAQTIVRNAEERAKPDASRDPAYQERNQKRLAQSMVRLSASYSPVLDRGLLALVIRRELARSPAERAGVADAVLRGTGVSAIDDESLTRAVHALYATTHLGDEAERLRLLERASPAELKQSKDAMIRLALALRPLTREKDERARRLEGRMALIRPRYVAALRAQAGGLLAPDANGTLRISFGTVRGYAPRQGAASWFPFTTLGEVLKKHTGQEPFAVPLALRGPALRRELGPYVDSALGDVPVDFLSDTDITGGNSGSATLNARGELVGLAFDGNYESIASEWLFLPEMTRAIHVDLRYMLWILEAVSGARRVLDELAVKPALVR